MNCVGPWTAEGDARAMPTCGYSSEPAVTLKMRWFRFDKRFVVREKSRVSMGAGKHLTHNFGEEEKI